MPTILVRDPTLVERLRKLQPVPDDAFDGVIYELLKRAEAASKPKMSGLDDLPRMVIEEIKKSLDGKLVEALKSALLPAVSNLSLEIPVELSIRVKLRFEPVFDVSPSSPPAKNRNTYDSPSNGPNKAWRTLELDKMEQQVVEYLRQLGGCFQGTVRELVRASGAVVDESLIRRLYKHLRVSGGKVCLPGAARDDVVIVE